MSSTSQGAVLIIVLLSAQLPCSAQEDDEEEDNPLEEYWYPPVPGARANHVNVSFNIMDVEFLDEKKGMLSAFIDMELSWRDARYFQRSQQVIRKECNALSVKAEDSQMEKKKKIRRFNKTGCNDISNLGIPKMMSKLKREYGRWQIAVLGRLSVPVEDGVVAWTPVPERLRSGNEDRRTKGDVIINFQDKEGLRAVLSDGKPTQFSVNLEYQHFPFDIQELDLCLTFERPVAPSLRKPRDEEDSDFQEFNERSTYDYIPVDSAPFINQKALDTLQKKGWRVDENDISFVLKQHYAVSEACVGLKVTRSKTQIWMRLFIPMYLLLFTPFFGFWLPVTQVMPRIATGFISFLSMQVFRSVAYGMMPRPSASLVWLDVMLTTSTELMFLAVLHNMAALVCQTKVSAIAAGNFDRQARVVYPATTLLLIVLLMTLGEHRVSVNVTMAIMQVILLVMGLGMTLHQIWYLRNLPARIVEHLIHDLTSGDITTKETEKLDSRELSHVFRLIDKDRSGYVSAEEILDMFQKFGWGLSENDRSRQKRYLEEAVGLQKGTPGIYFDDFAKHFSSIFGHSASRRMNRLPTPAKIEAVEAISTV